jgi:phosphoglycolate phosphatase
VTGADGRPQAVLFDLDGVLLDSASAIIGCINDALVALGEAPRPPAALRRYVGPPLTEGFAELVGPQRAHELVAAYRARYKTASLELTTVFAGMLDVLEAVGAQVPLGVATSKPLAYSRPLCDHLGLTPFFAAVAGPSLAETEPKAVTVRRALDELGLAPGARAPLVGDREHDVEAAHANGLRCVGVLWGFGEESELRAAGADALVREPAELPAALGVAYARPSRRRNSATM